MNFVKEQFKDYKLIGKGAQYVIQKAIISKYFCNSIFLLLFIVKGAHKSKN